MFSAQEIETLKTNSLSMQNAKVFGEMVESDLTIGGIFPNANNDDFSNANEAIFKGKWCSWWILGKQLLSLAKIFTGPKADKAIDKLIELGDRIC